MRRDGAFQPRTRLEVPDSTMHQLRTVHSFMGGFRRLRQQSAPTSTYAPRALILHFKRRDWSVTANANEVLNLWSHHSHHGELPRRQPHSCVSELHHNPTEISEVRLGTRILNQLQFM
jgi:hypothetical protein